MFSTPGKREQSLFIREGQKIIEVNQTHFEEGKKFVSLMEDDGEGQIFRNNSLFLSSLASFGFGKLSKKITNSISSISVISGLGHQGMYGIAGDSLSDSAKKKFILDFLNKADLGIEDLQTVEIANEDLPESIADDVKKDLKKGKLVISSRIRYNKELQSDGKSNFYFGMQESEGTRKMFAISPFIYHSLKEGTPVVIDEFDARFHPLLTKKIVELYNSVENNNAQIIFTTHDTNCCHQNY